MKFDEILEHIGDFGRYQKWIVYVLCITSVTSAFLSLSVIFLMDIPAHRCSLGENDTYAVESESHAHLVNMSIPWETDRGKPIRSSCRMYKQPMNGSHFNNETIKCTSWVFDKSIYESTLTEKFETVCDDRIYRSHSNMASFLGYLVGVFLFGILSDKFGRRPVILGGLFFYVIAFIAISFSPNVYVYMVLRAIAHFNKGGEGVVAYVLALEITGPSKRVFVGMVTMMAWGVGLFVLSFIAYFVRNWQTLNLIISVPCIAFAALYWFVCSMVYYGLGLNVQNLSGDIYLNFTIANIVEMASYFFCMFLLDRLGRKFLHCLCMFGGGIACISTMFPVLYGTADLDWLTVLLSMVGKFGISGAFAIIYIHSSELFPTIVRNSGLGTSSFCARIGGMVSPYIADLGVIVGGDLKIALPLIVFGAASLAAGFFSLYLPETLGKKLPETIEDAKNIRSPVGKTKEASAMDKTSEIPDTKISTYM